MKPYLPPYHRPPNRFVRYEEIDRGDYIERVAHYMDKNGKGCTMTAQIIWKEA